MKKVKLNNKKLQLIKEKVADLSAGQMQKIIGGQLVTMGESCADRCGNTDPLLTVCVPATQRCNPGSTGGEPPSATFGGVGASCTIYQLPE